MIPAGPTYVLHSEPVMPIIEDKKKRKEIIGLLTQAYWMEMETVMNFIACSINLDGVRAEEIKSSLQADIAAEMNHAQVLAKRSLSSSINPSAPSSIMSRTRSKPCPRP